MIALVFQEERFKSAIKTFRRQVEQNSIPTFISQLVEDEFRFRIKREIDAIGTYVTRLQAEIGLGKIPEWDPMKYVEIGFDDFADIDELTTMHYNEAGKNRATSQQERDLELDRIGIIQGWLCDRFVDLFQEGRKISLEDFQRELRQPVKELQTNLENSFMAVRAAMNCKKYAGVPDAATVAALDQIFADESDDKEIIASAKSYMIENNSSTILVTTDKLLLTNREKIGSDTGVWCATPASAYPWYVTWGKSRGVFK